MGGGPGGECQRDRPDPSQCGDEAEQGVVRPTEEPGCDGDAGEGQEAEIGQACEEKEGDCAARDLAARYATAAHDPGAESQPAGSPYREERVRGALREPDLGAGPPAHPRAEDEAKDDHVGGARERLEDGAEHQPAGLGPGEGRSE